MRVLVIVAHGDDEVLGCGGTIAKHVAKGDEISLLILCESLSARNNTTEDIMRKQTLKASKILGIKKLNFYDYPNIQTNKVSTEDMVKTIMFFLQKIKPDIVYTHHRGDVNIDHRTVFENSLLAMRTCHFIKFKKILCFEVASSTEWAPPFLSYSFTPNEFVDITKTMDKKLKAMSEYKTEVKKYPHPRSMEAIKLYAEQWGTKIKIKGYAEPFEVIRSIS